MPKITNFLHFDYIPYPLWRRDMAGWVKSILTPLYKRVYPLQEDVTPPQTPAEMADYLATYKLLGNQDKAHIQTLLAESSPQVDHAPTQPRPLNYRDINAEASAKIRVPAQWESAEAILLNLPILYPPLWEAYAQMIEAITPVAQVTITVPTAMWAQGAAVYLRERGTLSDAQWAQVRFLVVPTDDIWVRDYGPIVGFNGDGHRVAVNAYYNRHKQYPQQRDDGMVNYWSAQTETPLLPLGLKTEGGNLLSDGQGTLLMSEAIFHSNPQFNRETLEAHLHTIFDFKKLIITPRMRYESTGHIDLLVKLADAQTVMISAPTDRTSKSQLQETIALFERETNAQGQPYRIVQLPTPPLYLNWFTYPIRRSYTNSLTVNGRVLVPVYNLDTDAQALQIYRETLPDYEIIPIDLEVGVNGGGAVHCMTKEIPALQNPKA